MPHGNSEQIQSGELDVLPSNKDNPLSEVIANNIPNCEQLDILVGYFYFDGIERIRKTLAENKNIKIRILVGMAAGVDTKGLVEYAQRYETLGKEQIAEEYRQQLGCVIRGLSAKNDNLKSKQIACLYADMINKGRLLIRQTREPNHSKLYIFNQKQETDSCYLVGSSNFSQPGIVTRQELNVQIRRAGLKTVQSLFDALWKQAVPVTRYETFNDAPAQQPPDPIAHTVTQETHFADITPFDAYLMLMQRYLKMYEGKEDAERIGLLIQSAKGDFTPFQYQVDAVSRALTILRRSKGVLVADVVGLGKSIVAATIAKASQGPGIILCPPHLVSDWEGGEDEKGGKKPGYFEQFGLDQTGWRAFSMYQLDQVKVESTDMVIIDEAHRFRNPTLGRYADLAAICANRKVVLLTATPFNNRPRDIHALLGLFHNPNAACATGKPFKDAMERLDKEFTDGLQRQKKEPAKKAEIKKDLKHISDQVFQIMRDVTIRRNRIDLKNNPVYREETVKHLSEQQPPLARSYKLNGKTDEFFKRVLAEYFGGTKQFKGAIYRPEQYLKNKTKQTAKKKEVQFQENYYGMLCRFLVNRFESSFAAFEKSIESIKGYAETALKYLEEEHVLVLSRELFRRLEDQDIAELDFKAELKRYKEGYAKNASNGKKGKTKSVTEYQEKELEERFRKDVKDDIKLLKGILKEVKDLKLLEKGNDPKLEAVIAEIGQVLNNEHGEIKTETEGPVRKVAVFSGFADTVNYIGNRIKSKFKDKVLVVIGQQKGNDPEVLTLDEKAKKIIKTNFDAKNGDPNSPLKILVATDAISEGLNLNQAGLVINYDIPWNPTRVIQRIGRINRIGKKVFKKIYVMNLFPSEEGEQVTGQTERVKTKLQMIHDIVREDAQILDTDEDPQGATSLEKTIGGDVEAIETEWRSEETRVRELWSGCEKAFVKAHGQEKWGAKLKQLAALPSALKVVANKGDTDGLAVFKDNGLMLSALWVQDVHASKFDAAPILFLEALDKVACKEDTPSATFDEKYWAAYEAAMDYRPKLGTKSANNLWVKASNILSTQKLYEELSKPLNETRKHMLHMCDQRQLLDATLKKLKKVKTKQELQNVIEYWNSHQQKAGSATLVSSDDATTKADSVLAFGTSSV